jgi:hypothetical protein
MYRMMPQFVADPLDSTRSYSLGDLPGSGEVPQEQTHGNGQDALHFEEDSSRAGKTAQQEQFSRLPILTHVGAQLHQSKDLHTQNSIHELQSLSEVICNMQSIPFSL